MPCHLCTNRPLWSQGGCLHPIHIVEMYITGGFLYTISQPYTTWSCPFRRSTSNHLMGNTFPSTNLRRATEFFNSTIRTLLDVHLPERQIRRCSNDRPWVDDNFRHLIRWRQRALLGGDRRLYNQYRNKVNRERKSLQRRYYERKIQTLVEQHQRYSWGPSTLRQSTGTC